MDITGNQSDCMAPSMLLEDKKLHLVWLSVESNLSRVAYKNTPLNPYSQPSPGKTVYLSPEGYSCSSPQIYMVEKLIWCTWYQNDTLYASSSADGGMTWSPPKAVNWPSGIAEYTIRYSSNYQPEKEKVRIHSASAHFNNGISIPMVEITQTYIPAREPEKEQELMEASIEESRVEESKVQKTEDTEPPADEKFRLILDELQRLREQSQEGTAKILESLGRIQELEKQMAKLSEKVQKLLVEAEETKNEVFRLQEKGFIRSIFRSHRG